MVNTHKRGFAATFHQRHAGSITAALIEQVIDFLHQHYDAVWLSVSEETVPELKEAIRSNQQCTAIFIPAKEQRMPAEGLFLLPSTTCQLWIRCIFVILIAW